MHFGESSKLDVGPLDRRPALMHIHLTDGSTGTLAGIRDREGRFCSKAFGRGSDLQVAIWSAMDPNMRLNRHSPESEGRVAETVAKGESAFRSTWSVEPSVTDVETFAVDCSNRVPEIDVTGKVLHPSRPSHWQLARRIALAKDGISDSGTAFVSTEECLKQSGRLRYPGELNGHTRLVDDDCTGDFCKDRSHEIVGIGG